MNELQKIRNKIHSQITKDVTIINEINDFDLVCSQIYGKKNQEALRTIKKWLNKKLHGLSVPMDLSTYVFPSTRPDISMDFNQAYLNYEILRFSQIQKKNIDIYDIYHNFTSVVMDIDMWANIEQRKQGILVPPANIVTGTPANIVTRKRNYINDDAVDDGIGLNAPIFNESLNKLQKVGGGKSTLRNRLKSTRRKLIPKKRHQSRIKKQLPKRKTRKNQLSTQYKRHGKRTSKNGFHHERSK
jgi:hypothetical protein